MLHSFGRIVAACYNINVKKQKSNLIVYVSMCYLLQTNTGTPRAKRTRRNTYELEESDVQSPKPVVGSPGTKEIIESMDDNLTEGEMKEQLLNALDKKVQNKCEYLSLSLSSCFHMI